MSESKSESISIIRQTVTVAITFVDKPSEERRRQLKEAGFRYDAGHWYKSNTVGQQADDSTVAQVIAA
jgi:hypothetical protein